MLVKVKAPFIDEISGLAIIKITDGGTYSTLLIKLKFTCNKDMLDIKNTGKDTMILRPGRGDRNHRYKVLRVTIWFKQGIFQQKFEQIL